MKYLFISFFLVLFLTACAPSEQAIQTSIAKTQAAYTPTQQPTTTPNPTATPNPCTDKGWADIETYLKQFDQFRDNNLTVGTSVYSYLEGLENIRNKISTVEIDACSEIARQLFINFLGNQIHALTLISTKTDVNNQIETLMAETLMAESVEIFSDAITELNNLGIKLNYP